MPELPEVEAVRRKLEREVVGARIVRARMLRRPDRRLLSAARGKRINAVERRAKNLLIRLSGDGVIRVHLRMTGNLYAVPDHRFLPATARAWFELDDLRGLVFDDPRALGRMTFHRTEELNALLADLGPEPLGDGFSVEQFREIASRSRQPAKLFLLDQTKVAGLGNIYAAEVLHRAGIHPGRPMHRISRQRLTRMHSEIVAVLDIAVQSACRAYSGPGSYNSEENFPVAVYGREGQECPACRREVRRIPQGGRSTYYCPGCQR
jgi:formamidopyrimidine-DNA glycosylase